MTTSTLQLPDGTTLAHTRDDNGNPRGIDSETSSTLTYVGDEHGGRLVDADGAVVRELSKKSFAARPADRKPTSKSKDRSRWVTFNTFVDRVARHLETQEQAAWHTVFRWTQDDTAEIRIADIAAKIGRSTRSAQRAIERLIAVGLLERLKRGTRQGGPSRYRLEPDPAVALPRLQPTARPQHDTGVMLKQAPKHQRRDGRGAFTT